MLRLFVAEAVESLNHQHPQDHFHGSGVASEPRRVGIPTAELRFDPLEEHVVIEQHIELRQLRFHFEL